MKINGKEYKLPKRFKNKWVKALRSGKYKQGSGYLLEIDDNDNQKYYCCLGVACSISGIEDAVIENVSLLNKNNFKYAIIKDIPEAIKGSTDDFYGDYNPLVSKLTIMNDGQGNKYKAKSFNYIASYIERYL